MTITQFQFTFLDKDYTAEVEYFTPPTVVPYYKVNINDEKLISQFGMVHNFKESMVNGYPVLTPALDPQGRYHPYFWACLMVELYILLLNQE